MKFLTRYVASIASIILASIMLHGCCCYDPSWEGNAPFAPEEAGSPAYLG